MKRLVYLDCPTGIAGDMCLGALVDAGVPLTYLDEQLSRLGIAAEYRLWAETVQQNGLVATKVHVDLVPVGKERRDSGGSASGEYLPTFQEHGDRQTEHLIDLPRDGHSHSHSHSHSHGDLEAEQTKPHTTHAHHVHSHVAAVSEAVGADDQPHYLPLPPVRHLPDIEHLITQAGLPERAERWSLAIFRQLAIAEAAVHGILPEQVHFHEVGATDAIVDIVGTCLGLDWLQVDQVYCSALPVGGGTIRAAHGQLPVPAPAVLKLFELGQVSVYSNGIAKELVTPTGAAIATTLAQAFGPLPPMQLQKVGLGAGVRSLPIPNILRLWIGQQDDHPTLPRQTHNRIKLSTPHSPIHPHPIPAESQSPQLPTDESQAHESPAAEPQIPTSNLETITLLQTQIDDLSPQAIGYVFEQLFQAGALDVFTQAIGMKKSRPGILLSVICHPQQVSACETVIFQETTTLGIRRTAQTRCILDRQFRTVQTPYGPVAVKIARAAHSNTIVNVQPEFEDCAQLARQHQRPWREIHQLALQSWHNHSPIS